MNKPVNYPIAKILQEKCFDSQQPVAEYWEVDKIQYLFETYEEEYHSIHHEDSPTNNVFLCLAPTISDVVMWIYKKYGIWISVNINQKMERFKADIFELLSYKCTIDGRSENRQEYGWETPEEAYDAAIEYILQNKIN